MSEEKGSAIENQAQENQQEFSPITTQGVVGLHNLYYQTPIQGSFNY